MGNIFFGTKEEWLQKAEYVVTDIYDDSFAIDFSKITIMDRITQGEIIEEPAFTNDPFCTQDRR